MMVAWTSETDRTGKVIAWHLDNDEELLKVYIHRWMGLPGWFLTCHAVRLEKAELEARNSVQAQNMAIRIVRGRLKDMLQSLPEEG